MRAALLAVLTLLVLAGCAGRKEKGEQPAELLPITAELKVKRVWSVKVGGTSENLRLGLAPATDGSRIYAATHNGVVAGFEAESGKRVWRVELELPFAAGPAYGDGLLALGSSDGDLVLLSAADGEVRWQRNVGSEVLAKPLVARDLVIVRAVDGRLQAFAAADGTPVWNLRYEVPRLSLRGNSAPSVAGDRIIAGLDDGKVIALTLRSGDLLWEVPLATARGRTEVERLADVDADVRVVGNDLYAVGYQGQAAMLAVESGQLLWSYETSSFEAPGVDWVHLYVTDEDSEIVALDRRTGGALWRQDALRLRAVTGATPHGQAIAVGDFEGYVHWLASEDGRFLARVKAAGEAISNPPLVVGETLYVQSDDGSLSAYHVVPRG